MVDEDSPWIRIVRDRLVYANQYGALYDDDVEFLPLGQPGHYLRWKWQAPYSIAVLALQDPQTALLIRNFRHSARRPVLEVVKGFGDQVKAPGEIAVAELREELGFTSARLNFVGVTIADPSFACHPMHCFLSSGQIDRPLEPEHSEAIAGFEKFPLARVPDALSSGEIQDTVTLLLLWQAWWVNQNGAGHAPE